MLPCDAKATESKQNASLIDILTDITGSVGKCGSSLRVQSGYCLVGSIEFEFDRRSLCQGPPRAGSMRNPRATSAQLHITVN